MRIELARFFGRLRPLVAVLLLTLVAGCGAQHINVVRTRTLPPDMPKASFIMLQAAVQEGDANYDRYADQIARQLVQRGLIRVTKASEARYAVMFSSDEPDLEAEAKAAARRQKNREKYKDKDKDSHKDEPEDTSTRTLTIAIFDLTMPNSSGEKVFGAQAQCPPRKDGGGAVTPALIDAALKDFPGDEYETYSQRLRSTE